MGELVWTQSIEPVLDEHISRPTFERACRSYLWRALRANALPDDLRFSEVGAWWRAGDTEIDVMAVNESGAITAAGSCKWRRDPVDVREYQALRRDLAKSGEPVDDPFLFLFSRCGFTRRLQEIGRDQHPQRLVLVPLEHLYAV
jgi:hypothetical protein